MPGSWCTLWGRGSDDWCDFRSLSDVIFGCLVYVEALLGPPEGLLGFLPTWPPSVSGRGVTGFPGRESSCPPTTGVPGSHCLWVEGGHLRDHEAPHVVGMAPLVTAPRLLCFSRLRGQSLGPGVEGDVSLAIYFCKSSQWVSLAVALGSPGIGGTGV